MTKDEALINLLDIVEQAIKNGDWKVDGACDPELVIYRAKKALEQPTQEPVALELAESDCYGDGNVYRGVRATYGDIPTYKINTHPKEWQGLSEDELLFICEDFRFVNKEIDGNMAKFAKAIEQKIKEKNS